MNGAKALRQRASFSSRVMRREIMYATIEYYSINALLFSRAAGMRY
jgi:hypothetical protein